MKKTGLLNAELSALVARSGQGDIFVVANAGLLIPPSVNCIDLSVYPGLPGFFPVLDAILTELHIEASCIADEVNGALEDAFAQRLSPDRMSHKRLKENLKNARAIIRTGDMTPFANVMLTSGVTY